MAELAQPFTILKYVYTIKIHFYLRNDTFSNRNNSSNYMDSWSIKFNNFST
jgi:hypothetical protein